MYMSIGEAARFLGVSVVTLRRWHGNGKLTPRWRTPGGHRRYGMDDLNDMARQADRLSTYAAAQGWTEAEVVTDLGSGLNYRKRGLQRLIRAICRREVGALVLTRKDRLLRFGADLALSIRNLYGVRVVLIEDESEDFEDRLASDVIKLMTVFSARLHGRRSHRNRLAAAT